MNDEVRKELDAMLGVLEGSINSDDENLEENQDNKIIEEPGDDGKGEIEETEKIVEEDLETKDEVKDDTTKGTEQAVSDTERYRKENEELRKSIIQVRYDSRQPDLFECKTVPVRKASKKRQAFEPAWKEFREGIIYSMESK